LGWFVLCGLGVIGGFMLAMWITKIIGVHTPWLSDPALAGGAGLAGYVIARQGPMRSWIEPALGGVAAVILTATVSRMPAQSFGWSVTAMPWLIGAVMAIVSGAAACGGGWLAQRRRRPAGVISVTTLAMLLTVGVTLTGAYVLVLILKVDVGRHGKMFALLCLGGLVGGLVTQLAVAHKNLVACGFGLSGFMVLTILDWAVHRTHAIKGGDLLGVLILLLPGMAGAAIAWRIKPAPVVAPEVAAAFD
jgi:hypothetical protein